MWLCFVGAFNTGASYLSCLAAGMLVDLFGCRILTLTGTVFTCVGTFLAAFAKVRRVLVACFK